MKKAYIITGGTMIHVAPHFSLCAPAYGTIGEEIFHQLKWLYNQDSELEPHLILTRMASGNDVQNKAVLHAGLKYVETNDDLEQLVDYLIQQEDTKCIIMAAAVCDWCPTSIFNNELNPAYAVRRTDFGKKTKRLKTLAGEIFLNLKPSDKIISKIRKERKDIFLVGFKATTAKAKEETYAAGLHSLKANSANIVFANDVHSHQNIIITPEEYPYYYDDRKEAILDLCDMIIARSKLTFTRTQVVRDFLVSPQKLHNDKHIPQNFVPVLKYLIENNAYQVFRGKTTGHFGCKVWDEAYDSISSARKKDHNKVFEEGMVPIYGKRDDKIIAGGAKPSVGEHTQQKIYETLGDTVHSIVHFHSEMIEQDNVQFGIRKQFHYECGSNECALNACEGLKQIDDGIYAVHLDGHGPNIAFHKDVDPQKVILAIKKNWNLMLKTGGRVE